MTLKSDSNDLAKFGYKQELDRTLGSFSSFAAGFSYISILTGMFQMFYLGFGVGGPAFFWSWPLVLFGQFTVALMFAELAAHYPLSGGVFQWTKLIGGKDLGWMVGWIYTACLVVTLAAVALALQNSLPQISEKFQFVGNSNNATDAATNAVLLGCILIFTSTIINSVGVDLLAKINNLGVFTEIFGVVVLIILLALNSAQPITVVFETQGKSSEGIGYLGPFLAATSLTASYVMYGFDTAGSLAEETENPRKLAPRAILQALGAAGVSGLLLLLFSMMSARDLSVPLLGKLEGGLPFIIKEVLGETAGRVFLLIVIFAIFVCALAVQTGAVRLIFSMARDGGLPFSKKLALVSTQFNTPVLPVILVGFSAITILIVNVGLPKVIELVTIVAILWANLAYFILVTSLLWKRIKGWPHKLNDRSRHEEKEHTNLFNLGKWGIPLNIIASIWSFFMVCNVGWPREVVYGSDWRHKFAPIFLSVLLLAIGFVVKRFFIKKEL